MNAETFNRHLLYMQNITACTLIAKAQEYASDADRLHNFKVAGPLQCRTPIGALGGFMAKHTISVYDMIRFTDTGASFPLDMWEEKIKDHINYLFLLWGLVNERDEITEALETAITVLQEKAEDSRQAETPPDEPSESPEAPEKPKRVYNRKPAIVIPEIVATVVKIDADLTPEKPIEEGLGELDDAKLRRKVQTALSNYVAKHGADNLRPIIRATGNRVTEDTLRSMLTDITGYGIKHWVAVDTALKKLALTEAEKVVLE